MSRHCPIAASAYLSQSVGKEMGTWILASCLGFLWMSILRRPMPMAPDETMMTLWPSRRRRQDVSTISDKFDRSGSWVCSSQIELVPACQTKSTESGVTKLYDDCLWRFGFHCFVNPVSRSLGEGGSDEWVRTKSGPRAFPKKFNSPARLNWRAKIAPRQRRSHLTTGVALEDDICILL